MDGQIFQENIFDYLWLHMFYVYYLDGTVPNFTSNVDSFGGKVCFLPILVCGGELH